MTLSAQFTFAINTRNAITQIDALFPAKARLHGYQVAFGTLVAEKIRGKDTSYFKEIFARIGLPVSFQDLGLTFDEAVAVLVHAPTTRPERYSILKKHKLTASECQDVLLGL